MDKRRSNSRFRRCVVLTFVLVTLVIALFKVSDRIAAHFYVPEIQQAIDEQCEDSIEVESSGFSRDPIMIWSDRETSAVCRYADATSEWICNCGR
jgi:hypothetical protein